MDEDWASYPYQQFTITTFRAEGTWWARARIADKDVGGDRPVMGGPWHSRASARAAAEAFCNAGRAGTVVSAVAQRPPDLGPQSADEC